MHRKLIIVISITINTIIVIIIYEVITVVVIASVIINKTRIKCMTIIGVSIYT